MRGRERRGRHIVTEKKGRKKRCKGKGEGEERKRRQRVKEKECRQTQWQR